MGLLDWFSQVLSFLTKKKHLEASVLSNIIGFSQWFLYYPSFKPIDLYWPSFKPMVFILSVIPAEVENTVIQPPSGHVVCMDVGYSQP